MITRLFTSPLASQAASIAALVAAAIVIAAPVHGAVTTDCTMSGTYVGSDGRAVRETLDLGHDNSELRITDGDYFFSATATDDEASSPGIYGLKLFDRETGELFAFADCGGPSRLARLTAVISGAQFLGDGPPECAALTSPIDAVALNKQLGDSNLGLHVLSATFVGGPPGETRQVKVRSAANVTAGQATISAMSLGETWSLPDAVDAADLNQSSAWQPIDPAHSESVSVPEARGLNVWVQDETEIDRRVTLRYGDPKRGDKFVKQRDFDVIITKFGAILDRSAAPPAGAPEPEPAQISASVRGMFFAGGSGPPVYRTVNADLSPSGAPTAGKLTPVAGQVRIVLHLGSALAPRIGLARWTEDGVLTVQSVSSSELCAPIPQDTADPVRIDLVDKNGSVLGKTITLPSSVAWSSPVNIPVDFAVLDGLNGLDRILSGDTIWHGDDTVQNTCFAMVPETPLYPAMLLVPKTMSSDAAKAILSRLDIADSDKYSGPAWGMWGTCYALYTLPSSGLAALFGNLEPELGQQANIGFTSLVAGSPCSVVFIRLLPLAPPIAPLAPADYAAALGVAAHESFHSFMLRRMIDALTKSGRLKGPPPSNIAGINQKETASTLKRTVDLDKSLDSSPYVDAINELVQAQSNADASARMALYRQAIAARYQAVAKLAKADVEELEVREDQEGAATYFGFTAEQALIGGAVPLNQRAQGGFGSIRTAPPGGRLPLFYQYGYLACLALADMQPDWQTAWLNNSQSLSQMLSADVANAAKAHPALAGQ